jgi:uncharacterized protein
MTTQDDRAVNPDPAAGRVSVPAPAPEPSLPAAAPARAYPATASGVPLSAFAFAFAVGVLGLVDTGILPSAASSVFIATALGIGALGLLMGGVWEIIRGELFGGTFSIGYSGFLISTGVILKFFAGPMVVAAGVLGFDHAFAAWLIMWGIFTAIFAVGARTINLPAFVAFALAVVVFGLLASSFLGGTATWTSNVTRIGGWVALVDSLAAGYLASAILLNTTIGRHVLPLWPAQSGG